MYRSALFKRMMMAYEAEEDDAMVWSMSMLRSLSVMRDSTEDECDAGYAGDDEDSLPPPSGLEGEDAPQPPRGLGEPEEELDFQELLDLEDLLDRQGAMYEQDGGAGAEVPPFAAPFEDEEAVALCEAMEVEPRMYELFDDIDRVQFDAVFGHEEEDVDDAFYGRAE